MHKYILAIDTSCDETAVAITKGRRIIANGIYSQIQIHKKWGGVVPSLAKRAHQERIDTVIEEVCKKFLVYLKKEESFQSINRLKSSAEDSLGGGKKSGSLGRVLGETFSKIDAVAVTTGPGLAIALEVGITKAKELSTTYKKKLIPVNHMEGHIYSCFAQNRNGNPVTKIEFPYLAILVSGNHTEIVLFKDHISYEVLGKTIDDAAGEALDKAGRLLGLGYPAGPVIERLAKEVGNTDLYKLPRPMKRSGDLNFSFSGLKTAFYYLTKEMSEKEKNKNIKQLASSFQEAVFDSILTKADKAIKETGVTSLLVAGGVVANEYLRTKMRRLVGKYKGEVQFPKLKYLNGDNAAMIGIAAHFKAEKNMYAKDFSKMDRVPRLSL